MDEIIVKIEQLVKRYRELVALDHFNLEIKKGEIFGLLGPNGSGKTTAMNCMLSLLSYDKGNIELFGEKMRSNNYNIKRRIGVVPQEVAVFDELTVYENINYFCGLYINDRATRAQYVKEAIDFVALNEFTKFTPEKLSGGLKRRLNIACGIAHKPDLILLDEPTVAVDPQSRNRILEGILRLNQEGATIVYTSHYMEEVEQICSRISIMDKGKNLAIGTKEELKGMIHTGETIAVEILSLEDQVLSDIRNLPHVFKTVYENHYLRVQYNGGSHNIIALLDYLRNKDIAFGQVFSELPTLNDVFLEITGKGLRDS